MTHRSGLLLKQAELVTNQRKHLAVVRKMYEMRFPGEDVSHLTLQQLRGREGSRVRGIYKTQVEKWGVPWNGREYDPENFTSSDPVNQALSAAHACLYGLAHAVIIGMGLSPGLGFVHVGHERSLVYDIADLYKADLTIPVAFEIASKCPEDLGGAVRRAVRTAMVEAHVLERMVRDICFLFSDDDTEPDIKNAVYLWDNKVGTVQNARSYRETEEEDQ